MPSNQEAADQSAISPVLFLSVSGTPLRFYMRPGASKLQLQPLIQAGGGVLCGSQEPQAVLLADPEEMGSMGPNTAHWYVSTRYIRDCVEQQQQLEMEDYRLTSPQVQTRSGRQRAPPAGRPADRRGRLSYARQEDAAILKFISARRSETGGNLVWQEMEKKQVTNHSWQSMKHRYIKHLVHRLEEERKGGDTKEVSEERLPVDTAPPPPPPPPLPLPPPLPQELLHAEESPSSSPVTKRTRSSPESAAKNAESPSAAKNAESPSGAENAESPSGAKNAESPSEAENAESPSGAENAESPSEAVTQKAAGEEPSPKRARLEEEPATTSGDAVAAGLQQGAVLGVVETHGMLGILEAASREFDDSESDEDPPVRAEPQGPGPSLQEKGLDEAPVPGDVPPAKAPGPGAADGEPAPPHHFLFQSDSQEEEPRPVAASSSSSSSLRPIGGKDTVVSLTQAQLEEDKERIRGMMRQTNQDLLVVTRALLQSSGDVLCALRLLLAPCPPPCSLWSRHDDGLLLSSCSSPAHRRPIQEKHGQEGVATRLAYLDLV